jgi:hypothetical protein
VYRLYRSSPSGDFLEDGGGSGGPDEWLGFGIVLLQIGFDGGDQFVHAAEDAASNGVVGDQAEKPFDEIDPGRRCRGEVKVEARVALGA